MAEVGALLALLVARRADVARAAAALAAAARAAAAGRARGARAPVAAVAPAADYAGDYAGASPHTLRALAAQVGGGGGGLGGPAYDRSRTAAPVGGCRIVAGPPRRARRKLTRRRR
jgi:hypothetical protein